MNSELPGGLSPDELGPDAFGRAEPGLEQLLRTLTAEGTAQELAGEQAALAMFRAHVPAPAGAAVTAGTAAAGAAGAAAAPTRTDPAALPAGTRPMRTMRTPRRPRARGGFPRLRIAGISATAMLGGFAAAAYAAVLPPPVQHIAYKAFHYIGVPDTSRSHSPGGPHTSSPAATSPGGQHGVSPSSLPHPTPSVSARNGQKPKPKATGKPQPSTSPPASPSVAPTGPAMLSAQAVSTTIQAGTTATITGTLSTGGKPDAGVFVRLMERAFGQVSWVRVGRAQTDAQGNVAFSTPALTANARFRLADASGDRSTVMSVIVTPIVNATLRLGPKGIKGYVAVSTQFAHRGDVVLLQALKNGTWVTFKQGVLTGRGTVVFSFSATARKGQQLQVFLLPTRRHGGSTSATITVGTASSAGAASSSGAASSAGAAGSAGD